MDLNQITYSNSSNSNVYADKYGGTPECKVPIWHYRDEAAKVSYAWCGAHTQHDPESIDFGTDHDTDHDKDHDMALRQSLTFEYTGTQIADALKAQAVALEAKIKTALDLDWDTLVAIYDGEYGDPEVKAGCVLKEKARSLEVKNKKLQDQAEKLRREAAPYADAGETGFIIDSEDVTYFGLDAE